MALPFACHEFTSKVARETPKSAIVGTCFRGLIVVWTERWVVRSLHRSRPGISARQ